jgi:hypothetical protein
MENQMTDTMTKAKSAFEEAAGEMGVLSSDSNRFPFLDLRGKSGNWVTGTMQGEREISFVPKKGKNKGKRQTSTLYQIETKETNIVGADAGETYVLSVDGGLLGWQLTEGKPKGLEYPYAVAIRYSGKDDEGRHQTEVRFPKNP